LHVFFIDPTNSSSAFLSEEENHHAVKVLRVKESQHAILLDGKGSIYEAEFIQVNNKNSELKIIHKREQKARPYSLHIAIAPTKMMERFEWFLEKATEIGVDSITPILTKRTERNVVKMQRMEKIVHAAVKQSQNAFRPLLNELTSFKEFVNQSHNGLKLIAHCIESEKSHLLDIAADSNLITIMIGPEGDFTEDEVTMALKSNFRAISLGESRLRAETAGIVACSQVNSAWHRLSIAQKPN